MSTQRHVGMSLVYALCLMGAIFFSNIVLAGNCENWVAKAVSVQGGVEYRLADADDVDAWSAVARNDTFCQGDMVRTAPNARAALLLNNDSLLRLDQNSTVTFTDLSQKRPSTLGLVEGIAHFISRVKQSFKVVTPFVNALVEGTEFVVAINSSQQQTDVTVFEGRVIAANEQGQVPITNGQSAQAIANRVPERADRVRPRDAVQWALYYPPLLRFETASLVGHAASAWQSRVKDSIEYYQQANITEAFERLQQVDSDSVSDTRFFNYRASLALSVGRVEQAQADIKRTLFLHEDNADALALSALMAVVQGEKSQALTYAQQAVQADKLAAAPHLALSYVYQASFELEKARAAAQTATQLEENNALAWARLAELHLMFRELKAAHLAAHKAVELDPSLARTQTVLGFAQLVRLATDEASNAFDRAIALDSAAPLPRLGKGLALIRQGELAQGRREIEIAASLDPNHALIRSYLGKAYYEEKRDHLAADQYAMAKELDPLDPTPWLYDAIRKQSNNQPIEALRDLEQSVALNDNRAVYRSRLLLDEDQAAKSASQASIYQDLGFEHLARVESSKALMRSPANHAAHRLLADTYVGLPRHEIARVSELLQAQMLQPINVAPISPGASEVNLFNIEGTGPSVAYNEYNAMFNRNRFALQASGVHGSNDSGGEEIAAAGLFNRFSLSAGHFNHRSNGVRENNDSDKTIRNVFAQFRLTSQFSLQAEYRDKEQELGDMRMRFDPESFSKDLRRTVDEENWRIGLRYELRPGQTLLLAVNKGELEDTTVANEFLTLGTENETQQYEFQHLWQGQRWRGVAGFGSLDSDDALTTIATLPFPFPSPPPSIDDSDVEQSNAYFYNYWNLKNATLLLGAGYSDIVQKNGVAQNQFNPKLGLSWNIKPHTVFRAAAFRTLRREFTQNQTLEPTQVAGFNQFFDDQLGTEAWQYGLGLDQKINSDTHAGIEFTKRDITRILVADSNAREEDQNEWLHRAYLHWNLNQYLALSGEYIFEDFERDFISGAEDPDRPASLTTQRLPITFSLLYSSSLYAHIQTTYIDQEVTRVLSVSGTGSLNDHFWISDMTIGYRLPQRHGKIELIARNLGDKEFNYHSVDSGPGTDLPLPYYPESAYFVTLQLQF